VQEFENRFAAFVGSREAIATSSCTTALHAAMVALGLGPGDEVIVPAFTWISTANAVEYTGAKPVFCDIDLATFNLDVDRLDALLSPRTVGVVPVHLFGLSAEMETVLSFAKRNKLWVVEDAACALGTRYGGRHVGTLGDLGCFSFHPRKSITTGEGGMVTTQSGDLSKTVRALRAHGGMDPDEDESAQLGSLAMASFPLLGFNYRMTDLQGALGCVQMDKAERLLAERARLAGLYDQALAHLGWLTKPSIPEGCNHSYQSYVCLVSGESANPGCNSRFRNTLMLELNAQGIQTRQGTHAPALSLYYRNKYGLSEADFPNSKIAESCSVALPLFPGMTESDIERVANSLSTCAQRSGFTSND
jgi:dTDP-4-amino-4,6-dideoxygalactose transaminase